MSPKLPLRLMDLSRPGPDAENMFKAPEVERAEQPVPVSEGRGLRAGTALSRAAVGETVRGNITNVSAFIRRFELRLVGLNWSWLAVHNLEKLHFIAFHCTSFPSQASDFTPGTIM